MTAPATSLPRSPGDQEVGPTRRRTTARVALPVAGLLLGLVVGATVARSDPTQSEPYMTLQAEADRLVADLDAAEEDLAALEAELVDREARSSTPAVASGGAAPSGAFENCTAARAAGAAPVRRGDPGYGSHLDRDGDGIGCE